MTTGGPEPSGGYRRDVDGLRALAVGLVLLFHGFPALLPAGFVGVDVFFVISGYLITRILISRRERGIPAGRYFTDFYQHRIRRIFPALIVVLVACAVYGWFRLFPADYHDLTRYIAGGAAFVSNFLLAGDTDYFAQGAELKPLTHLWSLAIEEQFYLIWPLLILLVGRFAKSRWILPVLGVLTVASFGHGLFLTASDPTLAYYSPLSRGWELGVGGLVAALHQRGISAHRGPLAQIATGAALVAIVAGALLIQSSQFPGWQASVPVVATAAIVWFGEGTWVGSNLLGLRPVVFIGLISYPLYLWHWVLLAFLRIERPSPPGVLILAALGLSVVLAAATYYLVERPLRRPPLRLSAILALVAMAVLLVFSLVATTLKLSGVQLTATQEALSETYDPRPAYRFGECFLDSATQGPGDFAASCDPVGENTVLIWGDSLGAQLYPGLASLTDDLGVALAQRTATSCPAAIDDRYGDRGRCNELNAATRVLIEQTRPRVVVLDGRWPDDDEDVRGQLTGVIQFLRDNGAERVILLGPAPDWLPSLQNLLLRSLRPGDDVPQSSKPPAETWEATQERDELLRTLSSELGAGYLSLVDVLCVGDQCRIRITDRIPEGLVTPDHDHLTADASRYVFENLPPDLLHALEVAAD
jgi:peptidoglycan/LPS O-acetylase OafA/YrhL